MNRVRNGSRVVGVLSGIGICAWFCLAMGAQQQAGDQRAGGEASGHDELTSPLGRKFYSLPDTKGVVATAQKEIADATDAKSLLKLAQAQAAVWEYREAVETCTKGLEAAPDNADLYLERGHRELALREFA